MFVLFLWLFKLVCNTQNLHFDSVKIAFQKHRVRRVWKSKEIRYRLFVNSSDSSRTDHDPSCKTEGDHSFTGCRINIRRVPGAPQVGFEDGDGRTHLIDRLDLTDAQIAFVDALPRRKSRNSEIPEAILSSSAWISHDSPVVALARENEQLKAKIAALEAGWQPIDTAPTDGTEVLTCVGVHDWDIDIARFKPWHPLLAFRACWRSSLTGAKIQPKYWLRLPPRPTYDEEKS